MLPEATFIKIKVMKPSEIPSAIEKVRGIIIMIINDGMNSVRSDQSNFWIPVKISIDT